MIDTRPQGEQGNETQHEINESIRSQVLRRLIYLGWFESPNILALTSKSFEAPSGHTESVIAFMDTASDGNFVLKAVDHFSKRNNFSSCSTGLATDQGLEALHKLVDLFDQKVNDVCATMLIATEARAAA